MSKRHYRPSEIDSARAYAERLRRALRRPVRVTRLPGEVIVEDVEDQRGAQAPRHPDRRRSGP